MSKQISKQSKNDVEKRLESTVSEMNKIQKQINDLSHILENQKNLKSRHDALESKLNEIKHTAST